MQQPPACRPLDANHKLRVMHAAISSQTAARTCADNERRRTLHATMGPPSQGLLPHPPSQRHLAHRDRPSCPTAPLTPQQASSCTAGRCAPSCRHVPRRRAHSTPATRTCMHMCMLALPRAERSTTLRAWHGAWQRLYAWHGT
eukprot:365338-Chlamydomonas_euryale.AAC.36